MARVVVMIALALVLVLVFAGVALAASSPQDIYNDWADNGQLDGTYTCDELELVLGDATLDQYGDSVILGELRTYIRTICPETEGRGTFPFTGFQMLMAGLTALILIGGGVTLRLVSHRR